MGGNLSRGTYIFGHPIGYLVLSAWDMADEEVEGLKKRSPADNNGALGGFDPLQVLMVRFNDEVFSSKVITECIDGVIDCVGFALECIPVGGWY